MPERQEDRLQELHDLLENLTSQLLLAWTVLAALGFDLSEALDLM